MNKLQAPQAVKQCNQQHHPVADSHALQLAFRLLDLGMIERGKFTWIKFQHDEWCQALCSHSALDCRCNVEAVIGGRVYSFEDFVGQSPNVEATQ